MQHTGALRAPVLTGSAPGACGALTGVLKTRRKRHAHRRSSTVKIKKFTALLKKKTEKNAMQQIAQKKRNLPSKLNDKNRLKNQDF